MAVQLLSPQASGTQLRSLEKVLDDAHMTGMLNLSGRSLRDYPKIAEKFDLDDTVDVDVSKNKFADLPMEVCDYGSLERLNCYNNVIRSIPDCIANLKALTYLNISRNQLSVLPPAICDLSLEVLIVSNNKLVSLPPEIGLVKELLHLDVSCNEIATLPPHIGEMESLKELNVRRNHLQQLPDEMSRLRLVMLDIACNKITVIPTSFRMITTLEIFTLDNNPLTSPPAQVCTRGRVHIFKYLTMEALREGKRRGILEPDSQRWSRGPSLNNAKMTWLTTKAASIFANRSISQQPSVVLSPSTLSAQYLKSSPLHGHSSSIFDKRINSTTEDFNYWNAKISELRRQTLTADSGYVEGGGDKRWSASEPGNDEDEARVLAERAAQQKEHRLNREELQLRGLETSRGSYHADDQNDIDFIDEGDGPDDGELTPTQTEPDEFTKELVRQKAVYEEKKRLAREEKLRQKQQEEQRRREEEEQKRQREEMRQAALRLEEQERLRKTKAQEAASQMNGSVPSGSKVGSRRRPLSSYSFNDSQRRPPSYSRDMEAPADPPPPSPIHSSSQVTPPQTAPKPAARAGFEKGGSLNRYKNKHALPPPIPAPRAKTKLSQSLSLDTVNKPRPVSLGAFMANVGHLDKPRPLSSASFNENIVRRPGSLEIGQRRALRRTTVAGTENYNDHNRVNNNGAHNGNGQLPNGRLPERLTRPSQHPPPPPSTSPPSDGGGPPPTHPKPGNISAARHEAQMARRRQEEMKQMTKHQQKSALREFVKSRSPTGAPPPPPGENVPTTSPLTYKDTTFGSIKPRSAFNIGSGKPANSDKPNYTVKREMSKLKEEMERIDQLKKTKPPQWKNSYGSRLDMHLIEKMRSIIEARLKVTLPEDLPSALMDGVVLCHFVNNVRPHAVPSIHVPSPAVPKLNLAKCRRNVENFLKACNGAGVPEEKMCCEADILEGKGLPKVATTVQALLSAFNIQTNYKQLSAV
ncbi:LOW QUALITY PROTEIN: DISP complex protein LRCH3-like [Amphiura filiformis]|uniref:LOW QUALITY PROTEIN: DISP complex protein LRCH3-like n=1 Tax=Amphiura filiformis TaxID=82378 RepID=UPI003B220835